MTARLRPAAQPVIVLAIALAAAGCSGGSLSPPGAPGSSTIVTTVPPSTGPPAPTTTTTEALPVAPPAGALLQSGDSGPAVLLLQQRLSSLGYWLGTPDGDFGLLTEEAVVALQKVAGLTPDGVVGPLTVDALDRGVLPTPHSASGPVVEIDLAHQVLSFVHDGRVETVLDTSTGTGQPYVSQGVVEIATTPRGQFTVFRQVDGSDVSPLGVLWRPKYFAGGVAVHGYSEVPPYPASHGCVRVSIAAMDWIWSSNLMPVGTSVWVY